MGGYDGKRAFDTATMRKALRPVLLASPRDFTEHAPFLRRLLVGLADESIPAALICPPGCSAESVVPAPVDISRIRLSICR
jgi:hypothetical protein